MRMLLVPKMVASIRFVQYAKIQSRPKQSQQQDTILAIGILHRKLHARLVEKKNVFANVHLKKPHLTM